MPLSYEEAIHVRWHETPLTNIEESLDIPEDTKFFSFNTYESVTNLRRYNLTMQISSISKMILTPFILC